jgi:hypothetical protein
MGILGATGWHRRLPWFVVRTLTEGDRRADQRPQPAHPPLLAGQQIREFMFWVPQAGRLGISILSYAGESVYLGIATDAGLVPGQARAGRRPRGACAAEC